MNCKYIKLLYRVLSAIILIIALYSCANTSTEKRATISVSIRPVEYIVRQIVGDDFDLKLIVKPGSGPETYSPTASQISAIENSRAVFVVGTLNFEHEITERLSILDKQQTLCDLSAGVELLTSVENHEKEMAEGQDASEAAQHNKQPAGSEHEAHNHNHNHNHSGIDPHIWMSPKCLITMTENVSRRLSEMYPDSTKYSLNAERLVSEFQHIDSLINETVKSSNIKQLFIYHPALAYYGRDYGIEQISIEEGGKDGSMNSIKNFIDNARASGCKNILVQAEYPIGTIKGAIDEIDNIKAVTIDPLAFDISDELVRITELICE